MVVIKQHGEELEDELENDMESLTMDSSSEEMTDVEEILGHPINIDHTKFDDASFIGLPCPLMNLVPKNHYFFVDVA